MRQRLPALSSPTTQPRPSHRRPRSATLPTAVATRQQTLRPGWGRYTMARGLMYFKKIGDLARGVIVIDIYRNGARLQAADDHIRVLVVIHESVQRGSWPHSQLSSCARSRRTPNPLSARKSANRQVLVAICAKVVRRPRRRSSPARESPQRWCCRQPPLSSTRASATSSLVSRPPRTTKTRVSASNGYCIPNGSAYSASDLYRS